MRELGPTSRALVAAARDGMSPDDATAARVRAKLAIALGASTAIATSTASSAIAPASPGPASPTAAPGASAPTSSAPGASAPTASAPAAATPAASTPAFPATSAPTFAVAQPIARMSLAHKLAIIISVTAVVGTAVGIARLRTHTPATSAPALAAPLPDDELGTVDRAVAPQSPPPPAAHATPPANAAAAPVAEPASLAREVELVDRAMTEIRLGNPDAALTIVATFERETFGHGQLAEDIAAIDLEARCARGDDVTQPLAAFDQRYPSSAQRTRITAACNR